MTEKDFSNYLTHSREDEGWQMVCTDAGLSQVEPGGSYPPRLEDHPAGFRSVSVGRRINEYQMVYVVAGSGQLTVEDESFRVETGSLFLLFPGVRHAYRPDPEVGWTEYWVGFTGPQIDAVLAAGIINPSRPLFRPGYRASLVAGFHFLFEQVKSQEPLYQFRVCAEVMRLLAEALSLERLSVQQTLAQQIVEKVKAFIETNFRIPFDQETLGAQLGISLPHLNDVFKSYTGMTPFQYYLHVKINRAKEILADGESSVKEIAWKVGFDDQYYFSRLFKKKTGYSPSQWTELQTR